MNDSLLLTLSSFVFIQKQTIEKLLKKQDAKLKAAKVRTRKELHLLLWLLPFFQYFIRTDNLMIFQCVWHHQELLNIRIDFLLLCTFIVIVYRYLNMYNLKFISLSSKSVMAWLVFQNSSNQRHPLFYFFRPSTYVWLRIKTCYMDRAVSVASSKLLNSLPPHMQSATPLPTFKTMLNTHLFKYLFSN